MATDTASPWNLPYPEAADAPDGPGDVRDLADQLALNLARAVPCTSSTRPTHAAGLLIYETDTDYLQVSDGANWQFVWRDSGVVTSGFTAQTGWSNSACSYRLVGQWAYVHIECTRTGSDFGFASNGGLSDESVVALPSAVLNDDFSLTSVSGNYSTGGTFGLAARHRNDTAMWQIISGEPSTTIHSGDTVYSDYITRVPA